MSKVTPPAELVSKEIEDQIKNLANSMGIENPNICIEAATQPGDNYLGVIAKVQVQGKNRDSSKPRVLNLIVKSAPRNEGFRKFAPVDKVYIRENYMYEKVLPEFTKFQEKRGVLEPFKSYAKCYFTSSEIMNEALVMENMKEHGFFLRDRHHSLNSEDVMIVMREYGKFHAISYALRDQEPELWQELAKNVTGHFFDNWNADQVKESSLHQYGRVVKALDPAADKEACKKFEEFKDNVAERISKVLKAETSGDYSVIAHGDCWVNNILFKCGDPSNPNSTTELCFLDWQLACQGSPILDLSYFIFTCTDSKLRELHYEDFLNTYYKSLCDHLRKLGSDPDRLFPHDVFLEHWKKFAAYGLHMSTMVIFLMMSEVDEIPDFHNISDLEDVAKEFNYESKNVKQYNERMRGVVLDCVKYGYL